MKIITLTENEFDAFSNRNKYNTFYQSSFYADFAKNNDSYNIHYLGFLDDNDKLIGASMMLYKTLFWGYKYAYAPRGFLINYDDLDLIDKVSKEIKALLKKQKFIFVKIDPPIIASERDKEVKNIDGKLYWKCTDCGELVGDASSDDCVHGYYGYDYVQRVMPDENTWGETDLVCKNCKTVKQTFKIHPYSEYHVTDQNGQDVTLYGWFDDDAAREVFDLTNTYRQENGLNKLTYNTTCQDASNLRALEALVYWGHTRPNGTKWNTIIPQWKYGGENLAQNQRTPSAVMTAWKNSPGHNANLLYGINSGETPFKGLSVSCFHQLIIDEEHHYVSLEKVSWAQNFTFYQY